MRGPQHDDLALGMVSSQATSSASNPSAPGRGDDDAVVALVGHQLAHRVAPVRPRSMRASTGTPPRRRAARWSRAAATPCLHWRRQRRVERAAAAARARGRPERASHARRARAAAPRRARARQRAADEREEDPLGAGAQAWAAGGRRRRASPRRRVRRRQTAIRRQRSSARLVALGAVGHDPHVDPRAARRSSWTAAARRAGAAAAAPAACPSARRSCRGRATRARPPRRVLAGLDEQLRAEQRREASQRVELLALLGGRVALGGTDQRRRGRRRDAAPSARRGARRAGTTAGRRRARAGARRRPAARSAPSAGPRGAPASTQALGLDVLGDLAQRDLAQRGEVLDA